MTDIRQTPQWAKYLSNIGWGIERIGQNYIHIRKLPFFGSYLKIPRASFPIDLKKIDKIACKNKALFVKITPKIKEDAPHAQSAHEKLMYTGYMKDYWTTTISKTSIIDLTQSHKQLLKSFHRKTRYHINLAKRHGVRIIQSNDINLMFKLYSQTAKRNSFPPSSFNDINTRYKIFKGSKKAVLLFALAPDSEPVATLLMLLNSSEKEAFCSIAATSNSHRDLRASYLLHWEAMKICKKLGYQTFDFDGILDKRYRVSKIMAGSSFFKRGFRGSEVSFLGSYIKVYNPIFKFLFSLITKL